MAVFQGHTNFVLVFHNNLHDTIFQTGRVQRESNTQFYAIESFHGAFPFVLLNMQNGTNSMKNNPTWEANSCSVTQNVLIYDRIRSSIAVFAKARPALTQIISFHIITPCRSNILPKILAHLICVSLQVFPLKFCVLYHFVHACSKDIIPYIPYQCNDAQGAYKLYQLKLWIIKMIKYEGVLISP